MGKRKDDCSKIDVASMCRCRVCLAAIAQGGKTEDGAELSWEMGGCTC